MNRRIVRTPRLIAALPIALLAGCGALTSTSSPAAPASFPALPASPFESPSAPEPAALTPPGSLEAGGTGTTTKPAGTTTKPAGTVPACRDGDLEVELTAQDQFLPESTVRALVQATNVSNHACRISGWISVSLVDASGAARVVKADQVNLPGPPVPVDVDPGEYAPAGIKWTQCDPGDGSCRTGNAIMVTLPGGKKSVEATLSGFPPPERSGIAMAGLRIGTFQPSRIGVVAW